jgi:DNA-3-methyladenine glycosylase
MDAPNEDTLFDPSITVLLSTEFFARATTIVGRDLLGCLLVSTAGGALTAGRIVETEAYLGAEDPGSHAATKGVTPRNRVMFGPPGVAYVYFTYGNHYMLNAVCEREGVAGAVLIRALEPVSGIDVMTSRRRGRPLRELCSGPGKLTQALAIELEDNGIPFGKGRVALLGTDSIGELGVGVSGRIGLSSGHDLPLRFYLLGSEWVSKGRTGPR